MKILLLLSFLFFSTLFADNDDETTGLYDDLSPQVLYLSYTQTPQRVLQGEIFSITIKTLSTTKDFQDIQYNFSNYSGLKSLNSIPKRTEYNQYFLDTFYFLVTKNKAKLPDVKATLVSDHTYKSSSISGENLNVITLNPKKDFANIIANSFEVTEYKTTSFDNTHNIIVFTAKALNCDIAALSFQKVYKQGSESVDASFDKSKITYFAVINKDLESFSFSYFNLKNNNFATITLPIILDDDSVTTQTDIKPKDQSKEELKILIALAVMLIGFVLLLWLKKYIYLLLLLLPLGYIGSLVLPSKTVCIKQGSSVYILPVRNGTVFETTEDESKFSKEGSSENFVKIKLNNDRIGWVKNEDICSN